MTPAGFAAVICVCVAIVSLAMARRNTIGWSNEWLMAIAGVASGIGFAALGHLAMLTVK